MGGAKHEAGSGDGVSYRAPTDPSHCTPMCTVLCDPNYPPPIPPCAPQEEGWAFLCSGVGSSVLEDRSVLGGHKGDVQSFLSVRSITSTPTSGGWGVPKPLSQSQDCCWGCMMGSSKVQHPPAVRSWYLWVPEHRAVAVQLLGSPSFAQFRPPPQWHHRFPQGTPGSSPSLLPRPIGPVEGAPRQQHVPD